MLLKFLITFGLVYIISVAAVTAAKANVNKFQLKKFGCVGDNETTSDVLCQFKLLRYKYGKFSFGVTFKNPINNFWLDIKSYIKGSANYWRRGAIHIRQNLCNLNDGANMLILTLSPIVKKMLEEMLLSSCPYSGRMEISNFTIDTIDDTARLAFLATGDYKGVFQFIDMGRNKLLFEVEVVNYYKGSSLTQT